MQRKNLIIDENLLKEAMALLGAPTLSETVNASLREVIRLAKIKELSKFFGKNLWVGDLSAMREDAETKARSKKMKRKS